MDERAEVKRLFEELTKAPTINFPKARGRLEAPKLAGVYVIYNPVGAPLYVGKTKQLRRRLARHMRGRTRLLKRYMSDSPADLLRTDHTFVHVLIPCDRLRTLVEFYAAGCLCPKHFGTGARHVKV